MADTLDQDLEALKEWLGNAWRQLAQPSMTRFDRRELRNYMRQAETALQIASKRAAERDNRRRELFNAPNGSRPAPDLRLLNILAGSSRADSAALIRGVRLPITSAPLTRGRLQFPYWKRSFHCLKSWLGETICRTSFRLLNLDPALANQFWNHLWAVRHTRGFDPARISKTLHDLPLTGIGRCHNLTFARYRSTARDMPSDQRKSRSRASSTICSPDKTALTKGGCGAA